ncbi:transposase, partial [Novosphingobium sp. Rr 2-17]
MQGFRTWILMTLWRCLCRIDGDVLTGVPCERNTEGEREAIKSGMSAKEIWPDEPNKAAQKDTDARWTL